MADGGVGEAMIISSLIGGGASLAGGALAPSGQNIQSFSGTDNDPDKRLSEYFQQNHDLMDRIGKQQFSLPDAVVQHGPTFTGGGLPMPIGLTGQDHFDPTGAGLHLPGPYSPGAAGTSPSAKPMANGPFGPNTSGDNVGPDGQFTWDPTRFPAADKFKTPHDEALSAVKVLQHG